MSSSDPLAPELVAHLVRTTGLEAPVVRRIIDDVLGYHREDLADFIRRRHRELKQRGVRNEAIYPRLVEETAERVFAVPALTERQVRRLVYG